MSYSANELFKFFLNTDKKLGGYSVFRYQKRDDPDVAEIEIPAEYNGMPVTAILGIGFASARYIKRVFVPPSVQLITRAAFYNCAALETVELSEGLKMIGGDAFDSAFALKSICLPESLESIGDGAFRFCENLESVEFKGAPQRLGARIFRGCDKLPAETVVMGLVRFVDISAGYIRKADFREAINCSWGKDCDYFRPDVFELLAKNNSFRHVNVKFLFEKMIDAGAAELFPIAEKYGMLSNADFLDMLINYAAEYKKAEMTAYLLELKRRKFGFDKGGSYEL